MKRSTARTSPVAPSTTTRCPDELMTTRDRVIGSHTESLSSRTAIILEGARQAIDRGYHILNCSLGCGIPEHVLKYKTWVDEAFVQGVHVVAACNNVDFGRPEWPAFFTSVLAVNIKIGTRLRSPRSTRQTVIPSTTGIDTSSRSRSAGRARSASSASAPLLTALTS